MISKEQILEYAKATIQAESQAISNLAQLLTDDFPEIISLIANSKHRLIVTGIGKSAIIAQKIVATMNSTGTPSLFLHASEAIHGDLGMVQPGDIVICISKSGNSPEIKTLVPILNKFGNTLIAMTGNLTSFLAKNSQYILDTTVAEEACPLNLAPTNSTTAQLVMGDCLAVCLMKWSNFTPENFATYHPGGALGKKLLLRVKDLCDGIQKPMVSPHDDIKKVIFEISAKRLGVTAVVENDNLLGIITDGDIRRMLATHDNIAGIKAADIMIHNPKVTQMNSMVVDALNLMEDFSITQLLVVEEGVYKGVIHLHDILKEGIA